MLLGAEPAATGSPMGPGLSAAATDALCPWGIIAVRGGGGSGDNKIDLRVVKEKKKSVTWVIGGEGEVIRFFSSPLWRIKLSSVLEAHIGRDYWGGAQDYGNTQDKLNSSLTPSSLRSRGAGGLFGCFVLFFFFLLPSTWRQRNCPSKEEPVGMMPLQESHPWGKGCSRGCRGLALQADLGWGHV